MNWIGFSGQIVGQPAQSELKETGYPNDVNADAPPIYFVISGDRRFEGGSKPGQHFSNSLSNPYLRKALLPVPGSR
jgi:hypothetical protein